MLLLLAGAGVAAPPSAPADTYWGGSIGVEFSVADPTAETQDWQDITALVRNSTGISISRGRSTEFDQFRAGTCDLVLSNAGRLFDPLASGAYFGYLTPGRRLRVTVTFDAVDYTLFEGFIEGWPQEYDLADNAPIVPITAVDWFGFAAGVQFADTGFILDDPTLGVLDIGELGGDYEEEYSGERIDRIAATLGIPDDDRSVERGASRVQADAPDGSDNLLGAMQELEDAEDGFLFVAKDGTLTFLGRHSRFELPRMTSSQATFADDGSGVGYQTFGFDYSRRYVINEARYSRRGGVVQVAKDTTSRDTHGRRSDTKTDLVLVSDADVLSRAAFKVQRYKDPTMRPRAMTVKPRANPDVEFPVVLASELLDRVTVSRFPQGIGSAHVADHLIQTLEMDFNIEDFTVSYTVSPVDVDDAADYFTLDVDQLDQEILAY